MCGIAGVLTKGEARPRLVSNMLDCIAHRGPDGSGVVSYVLDNAASLTLGHRRLAILDLSEAGAQPMADDTEIGGQIIPSANKAAPPIMVGIVSHLACRLT